MLRLLFCCGSLILCFVTIAQRSTKLGSLLGEKTFTTLYNTTTGITLGKVDSTLPYTLIDYYFAGCKPCNANLSKLQKLQEKFSNRLQIVAINPIDDSATIVKHRAKYNLQHTIIWGKAAWASKDYFGLPESPFGYPFYLLITPTGKLIYESINSNKWHKEIARLLMQ